MNAAQALRQQAGPDGATGAIAPGRPFSTAIVEQPAEPLFAGQAEQGRGRCLDTYAKNSSRTRPAPIPAKRWAAQRVTAPVGSIETHIGYR